MTRQAKHVGQGNMMSRKVVLIAFSLTLVSCNNNAENASERAGATRAEVLPGTISDAMLHADQSRTQAPLIEFTPAVTPSALPKSVPSSDHSGLPTEGTLGASKNPAITSTFGTADPAQLKPIPAAL